ncbi:MAG: hypothetical protein M1835_003755 [Candelina submexicana]|nr:MAG: hypothetical protein M1835_003755 [Candelina submexicana]
MRPSLHLLAPGFFRRSLDEFKRLSNIALKQEGLRTPTKPYVLLDFSDQTSLESCKTLSDADIGGFSRVSLEHISATATTPPHARFSGNISIELPSNRPQVHRTGYAAWRSIDRGFTLFGKSLWDIDPYTYLALRFRSDGRKYLVNVQTDSIVPTDLHQHRLYAQRPGEWETVLINWNEFVRTNHGAVVEPQSEMLRQKVRTVGIGLIDRVPGDFELGISRVWATNGLTDTDLAESRRLRPTDWQLQDMEKQSAERENGLR